MNDISTTRYVIIIILDRHFINYQDNKSLKSKKIWIYGKYKIMVVEKEGFGAFKNNDINMLLF